LDGGIRVFGVAPTVAKLKAGEESKPGLCKTTTEIVFTSDKNSTLIFY
jgi:hypothetical protein